MDVPSEDEVWSYFDRLSNWGRWGGSDERGTLNYLSPQSVLAAKDLIESGEVISCSWDIDVLPEAHDLALGHPLRFLVSNGPGLAPSPSRETSNDRVVLVGDWIGLYYHGHRVTHLDALCHYVVDGSMYNGRPGGAITSREGAKANAVTGAQGGVVARAILVDLPKLRNVDCLEPGEFVTARDLDQFFDWSGLESRPGDVLLLRTGYGWKRSQQGPDALQETGWPGWHVACLPWMHEHEVAMIGADTSQEVSPSGYGPPLIYPLHAVAIRAMGLWLLDNCNLEELSSACARVKRWEFFFTLAPLALVGSTGSPVNPVAIL